MPSSPAVPANDVELTPRDRVVAFVNPRSPNGADARAALLESGRFEVHELVPATLRPQIEDAVSRGARRIAVAGGDGTLGTAAAALLDRDAELALIPAGTLNHFAKDHGIPDALREAVAAALGDAIHVVDVGTVSDQVFLNTASVGVYVEFVRARERLEKYVGYRMASLGAFVSTLLRARRLSVELRVGGVTRYYRTPLLFVGVGERELKAPKFGGRIAGGRRGLHVLVVRGGGSKRLVALAVSAAARGVDDVASGNELDSFVVDRCTVRVGHRRRVTLGIDGELIRVPAPLEFILRRDALRVVAARPPADAPPEDR